MNPAARWSAATDRVGLRVAPTAGTSLTDYLESLRALATTGPFWWFLLATAILALTYVNVGRWTWLAVLLTLLGAFTWFAVDAPLWGRALAWAVVLIPWAILALPALRRPLLSLAIYERLRARVPELSAAELTTLRTGNVWWEGAFFAGAPGWRRLMDAGPASLSESERRFVTRETTTLCDALREQGARAGAEGLPSELLARLRRKKFFALNVPPRYGGPGYSRPGVSAVLTCLATRQPAISLNVAVGLAPAELLLRFGTEEQKSALLPALASGEALAALAVSGLEAGSDLAAMTDTATVVTAQAGPALRLDFDKRYVTLAAHATHLVVAARVADPDGLLGADLRPGLSLLIVATDTPGVVAGRRHRGLDPWLDQGPVAGAGVELPIDAVIGGRERIGHGWHMLAELQVATRALGVPAAAAGAARLISRVTGAYARIRYQFRTPIGFMPGVQESLARIGAETYALEALRRVTMSAFAAGKEPAVISSIAKYQAAERLRPLVADALEIHASKALCRGPRNLLEPFLHLPALCASVDGPDMLLRNLVIYGQGLLRSHPFVARELEAVRDPDRLAGAQRFDRLFGQHIGFTASAAVRALLLSLFRGRLVLTPRKAGWTRVWFRRLSRLTAAFAFTNDVLLAMYGGNLKTRQRESARMADILSQLYTASAVLKYYRDEGSAAADRPLAEYVLYDCFWQMQRRFNALFANLPRPAGWLLRLVVFPFGRPYRRQPDTVEAAVADLLLVPSSTRNRLTGGIGLPADPDALLNRLEQAHARVVEDKPLYRKLAEAHSLDLVRGHNLFEWIASAEHHNVLTADEIARLRETERMRLDALAVDDEPPPALRK